MAVQTQTTWFVWALLLLAACGDSVTVNGVAKGALGESCRARNDCDEGLFCRDLVCTNSSPTQGADGGVVLSTRGDRGETCQRRDDCQASLACIGNVCTDAPLDAGTDFSSSGKRGEDCEATRDCAAGLVCVNSRCRESNFGLDYTPKVCDVVECAANADCCKSFEANRSYTVAQCNTMKATCEAGAALGVAPTECSTYRYYCVCPSRCDQESCKAQVGTSCLISSECDTYYFPGGCVNGRCAACTSDSQCLQAYQPYCVANQCVACKANEHCPGAGQACVMGVCQSAGACTLNEHCGTFEACQSGKCVDVGCGTDRECFFETGNERAKCQNKKCTSPCESDAECGESFHICHEGNCQFVGCNTDEECRIERELTMQSSSSVKRAVCREPKL